MTNRELLMMLDGDLGERAVKNCIELLYEHYSFLDSELESKKTISEALMCAFPWHVSNEGTDFWKIEYKSLLKSGL